MRSSLFFIVHRISMNRQRTKIRVSVCWAVMATLSRACQSEGLGSQEARRHFQLHRRGARVCGDQRMHGYLLGRGVGGRVVTALSSLVFPHDQVFRSEFCKVPIGWMSSCGDLPRALDLVLTLVILIRCSTNNSLQSYIRSMSAQVVVLYLFYFLFSLYSLRLPR